MKVLQEDINYKKVILELGDLLVAKKSINLKIIEFMDPTELFSFVVILTVESFLHQKALSNLTMDFFKKNGLSMKFSIFLNEENPWVLMDYDFLAIHIFRKEYRDFYNLEELWLKKDITILYPKE